MRTTITLPEPLLESAKRRAAKRGITLSEVIEDALRVHLSAKNIVAAPAFHLHTVRGEPITPHRDLDRTSALITEEDEAQYSKRKE